ncbi:MAG: nuclear transport factor 2 family protein, partial [Chloroflexi bacterium]|nr:nuclear transport factor 2 family protein [Chloroflexota bacterium]
EEIKRLKARYFRLLDTKRWDEWGDLFTEDLVATYEGPHPEIRYEGRADIVARMRDVLADAVTVHHGHMPEIELTSANTATGTWAMFDYVQIPGFTFRGYGHYEEEYVKEGGKWRIKRLRLTRIRVDVEAKPATAP